MAPMPLTVWTRAVVQPLDARQRRLLASFKPLASAREDPESIVRIILGETPVDPLGPEGALASYLLHLHCIHDPTLAARFFEQAETWRTLTGHVTALVARTTAAPTLMQCSCQVRTRTVDRADPASSASSVRRCDSSSEASTSLASLCRTPSAPR